MRAPVLIPFIQTYIAHAGRLFRDKARPGDGYNDELAAGPMI
ncbi:hypothetical protein [Pleomorphomonas sp. T1.2MG-36]|nr:hypothetical protein [Pleomorphomonas sp. T1.2MG-36]